MNSRKGAWRSGLRKRRSTANGGLPSDLWQEILGEVRPDVNPQSFKTWLEPTRLLPSSNGKLRVQVPTSEFKEWIEEHHLPLLLKAAKKRGVNGIHLSTETEAKAADATEAKEQIGGPISDRGSLAKLRTFSSIQPRPLNWLWPGRIPLGKLTIICGDPGNGKSLITIDLAARVSTGSCFPDGAGCQQGSVVLLSAEDDQADTIRPRLDAAGANVKNVHWLEAVRNVTSDGKQIETAFSLERDIEALGEALYRTGARLVVIDPISAYLGGTDSRNNSAVRGLLSPLAGLAAKYGTAVVAVTHLRKSSGTAINRIVESLAFGAAARAVWGVAKDPRDKSRRLFLAVKQNLAPESGGLAYSIRTRKKVPRIVWSPGEIKADADLVLRGFDPGERRSERAEAMEWLEGLLSDGPKDSAEVKRKATEVGLSWATVRRAKDELGIKHKKPGGRGIGWVWVLKRKV